VKQTYLVNEIYSCLQGEGPNIGMPSTLIRFQICNLRCSWCDTPYTHTIASDSMRKNHRVTIDDLALKIASFPQRHLILTGGEPTLQNIGLLMRTLGNEYEAEVESNGSIIPHEQTKGFLISDYDLFQWNISPKFSNANETIVDSALLHWSTLAATHPKVFFKFVVRDSNFYDDMTETNSIIEKFKIPKNRIFLMPEGTSFESQTENARLAEACVQYGFRYTPRLHILLFGNQRGY